jgi:hypothetical protein
MSRASLSRSFVCRLHSFPRWSFFISADSSLQENEIFDGQVEKIPYACTPVTTHGSRSARTVAMKRALFALFAFGVSICAKATTAQDVVFVSPCECHGIP